MKIAILGTGAMATGLAKRLSHTGHGVVLGSRRPIKANEIAAEVGRGVQAASISDAAAAADVIVLAVPYTAVHDTLAAAGELVDKIIVDITNPLTADFSGLIVGHTTSAAEEIQKAAPGAKVVKALNTIFARLLANPIPGHEPLTAFYAGDDTGANEKVRAILERIGFRAEYAGPLKNARYLEPLAALNIAFGYALGAGINIAPEWRRLAKTPHKTKASRRPALIYELLENP